MRRPHQPALIKILFSTLVCFLLAWALPSQAEVFEYNSGRAEADGRKTRLKLIFTGKQVSGSMTADPVCKVGMRLTKTQIEFKGTLSGSWEKSGSSITAQWKGGDYGCTGGLMKNYPTKGNLTIVVRPNTDFGGTGLEVYLKRQGLSRYGYVFKPLGKVYKASASSPFSGGQAASSTGFTLIAPKQDNTSLGAPAASFKMPSDLAVSKPSRTIALSVGESQTLSLTKNGQWFARIPGKPTPLRITSWRKLSLSGHYASPGILKSRTTGNGVTVTGLKAGAGTVVLSYSINVTLEDGSNEDNHRIDLQYLVLVGKEALAAYQGKKKPETLAAPNAPPADIPMVKIKGRALRRGSKAPVGQADIYLAPQWTQKICNSRADGTFNCTFNDLRSGRYEIMIQKRERRTDLGPAETVNRDLWPVKTYLFDLDPALAKAGVIDLGIIWMDRIGILSANGGERSPEVLAAQTGQVSPKQNADQLWQQGKLLINQGKTDEGLSLLKQSLKLQASPQRNRELKAIEKKLAAKTDKNQVAEGEGEWLLVKVLGRKLKPGKHQCYKDVVSGGEGSVVFTVHNLCTKPKSKFVASQTWTRPPARLLPEQKAHVEIAATRLAQEKSLFQNGGITVYLEPVRISCGYTTGGSLGSVRVRSKVKESSARKKVQFKIPKPSKHGDQLTLNVCPKGWEQKYIYQYVAPGKPRPVVSLAPMPKPAPLPKQTEKDPLAGVWLDKQASGSWTFTQKGPGAYVFSFKNTYGIKVGGQARLSGKSLKFSFKVNGDTVRYEVKLAKDLKTVSGWSWYKGDKEKVFWKRK
ncbi:hypothetical protein [Dethiosulfatarculus sandiegensis]|uniref:GOLD domain-containing protein n=1 Tax=Dethiosulfatarculus sandiegensis TaxID=1429043 RepID=A0A0D2IY65_9BACT|nr:hypothetical protein [Dethiosulfatarculus sandiegensis]KIX10969.1 hypothetical protein X474_26635 [Dethiosulfatarculus sandiegensis]